MTLFFLAGLIAGSLLITGCQTKATPKNTSAQAERPTLAIPASFASAKDKREFAVKAGDEGYWKESKQLLMEVTSAQPEALSYSALATAMYNLNDYDGAMQAWKKAAELDPRIAAEVQNNIGNALRDSNRHDEAKSAYLKALELEPAYFTATTNLATMLKLDGKLEEAVGVLEKSVASSKTAPTLTALLDSYRSELKK